jgi:hypothetical protein
MTSSGFVGYRLAARSRVVVASASMASGRLAPTARDPVDQPQHRVRNHCAGAMAVAHKCGEQAS